MPIYLELVFGNGERYTTEVLYFLIPDTSGSGEYCNGFGLEDYNYRHFYLSYSIQNALSEKGVILSSSAVLLDKTLYSFHEAKNYSVNMDTRTVTIELWRDEPYLSEREYFSKNEE